jgi:hypothetical protein
MNGIGAEAPRLQFQGVAATYQAAPRRQKAKTTKRTSIDVAIVELSHVAAHHGGVEGGKVQCHERQRA